MRALAASRRSAQPFGVIDRDRQAGAGLTMAKVKSAIAVHRDWFEPTLVAPGLQIHDLDD